MTGSSFFVGQIVMRLAGLLPLFMYASYTALQLEAMLGR